MSTEKPSTGKTLFKAPENCKQPPSVPAGSYYHPDAVAELNRLINQGKSCKNETLSQHYPPYDPEAIRELARILSEGESKNKVPRQNYPPYDFS